MPITVWPPLAGLLALAVPLASPPSEEETEDRASTVRIDAVVLDGSSISSDALRDELRLRAPGIAVIDVRAVLELLPERFVYVRVVSTSPEVLELELVTWDGRGYARRVPIGGLSPVRAAAIDLGNLLPAIAEDSIAPTRQDAEIPDDVARRRVDAQPQTALEETPPEETPPPPREEPEPSVGDEPVGWSLGVSASGGGLFGLGRPDARRRGGFGGGVGLRASSPRGVVLELEARTVGRRDRDLGLARIRVAGGAGYRFQRGRFELVTSALVTVEPWWVTDGGGRVSLRDAQGDTVRSGPLLGGAVRIAPGIRIDRPRVAFRVAPTLELAGSADVRQGRVGRVVDRERADTPVFRLGGFEVWAGLELGLWLPLRPRATLRAK